MTKAHFIYKLTYDFTRISCTLEEEREVFMKACSGISGQIYRKVPGCR